MPKKREARTLHLIDEYVCTFREDGETRDSSKSYNMLSNADVCIWRCVRNPEHKEWKTSVNMRFRGLECPECSSEDPEYWQALVRPVNETKSLAVLLPDSLKLEWDEMKNTEEGHLLSNLTMGSNQKVWWRCPKHGTYKSKIRCRTGPIGTNCPICRSSKMELNMLSVLQKFKDEGTILALYQQFRLQTKPRPCMADFAIEFYNMNGDKSTAIIEMNGRQHFQPVAFHKASKEVIEEEFRKTRERDQKKDAFLTGMNISCLHISYEVEADNYEGIVLDFLAKAAVSEISFTQRVGEVYLKQPYVLSHVRNDHSQVISFFFDKMRASTHDRKSNMKLKDS